MDWWIEDFEVWSVCSISEKKTANFGTRIGFKRGRLIEPLTNIGLLICRLLPILMSAAASFWNLFIPPLNTISWYTNTSTIVDAIKYDKVKGCLLQINIFWQMLAFNSLGCLFSHESSLFINITDLFACRLDLAVND